AHRPPGRRLTGGDMPQTHMRAITALLTGATLALTLTACDPEDPEPTPSPSSTTTTTSSPGPTPTETASDESTKEPTQSYQDSQIEAAKQFVIDSYAAYAELAGNGYENWQQYVNKYYSGREVAAVQEAIIKQSRKEGEHTKGATEVVSITATQWEKGSNGHDAVTFELCLDSRNVVIYENGTKAEDQPMDHQYPATVTVIGQPDSPLGWSYIKEEVRQSSC